QLEAVANGLQLLIAAVERSPAHLPVAIPIAPLLKADSGKARPRPVQPLRVIEGPAVDIAQRQVRQVELIRPPGCVFRCNLRRQMNGSPEKREFESIAMSISRMQI